MHAGTGMGQHHHGTMEQHGMAKLSGNLQDSFLNSVRKENQEVKVLLVNGTTLQGHVKGFDNFTFVLHDRDGQQHLVYKHAVAHLVSRRFAGHRHDADSAGKSDHGASETPADRQTSKPRREPEAAAAEKPRKEGFNKIDLSGVSVEAASTPKD
jgi:host factor-I protein